MTPHSITITSTPEALQTLADLLFSLADFLSESATGQCTTGGKLHDS